MESLLGFVLVVMIALCIEIYIATGEVVGELQAIRKELSPTRSSVELAGVVLTDRSNLADKLITAIQQVEKAVVKSN